MGGPQPQPPTLGRSMAYASVSLLLGLTQGLGFNLVNNNLPWIQGSLGAYANEAAWLSTAYTATNATIALLAIKFRFQFGLRLFGDIGLGLFIVVAIAHLFTNDLRSAIAVRAASGVAATALSTLALLYMIAAVPEHRRPMGIALGVGWSQLAAPLSRLLSSDLLEIGQWHGLYLVEIGLSLLCLAAVNLVRVPPIPRVKMFQARDFLTFALFAPGVALLCAVLSQGRFGWWFDTPWLGWALALAIVLLAAAVLVELHRAQPLLHLRWLTSADMLRLVVIILLFRIVLSEQGVGAFGFLQAIGMNNDQMRGLSWVMFWATLAGVIAVAVTINPAKVSTPALIALLLIAAAAWTDSHVTNLTRPAQMYLSQGLIAFASALFLPAAMLAGFSRAMKQGQEFIVSFAVIFGAGQSLGAMAGSAFLGTLWAVREKAHSAALVERLVLIDPLVAERVRQYVGAQAGHIADPTIRQAEGLVLLSQAVTREATVLAYADVFRVIAVLAVLVFFYLLALRLREDARTRAAAAMQAKAA